jgi:hypothetical protein
MSYGRYRYHRSWSRRRHAYHYRQKTHIARRRARQSGTGSAVILVLIIGGLISSYNRASPVTVALTVTVTVVCLIAIIGIATWRWLRLQRAYRAIEFYQIDSMTGPQFEDYMVRVFRNLQFGVKHIGKTGDQGCDLILVRNGKRIACQLKRYAGAVGNFAVQEAVAAVRYYGCDASMVVTNSHFTTSAKALAIKNNCELIERDRLGIMIASLQKGRRP